MKQAITRDTIKKSNFTGDLFCIQLYSVDVDAHISDEEAIDSAEAIEALTKEFYFEHEQTGRAIFAELPKDYFVETYGSMKTVGRYEANIAHFEEGNLTSREDV